MSINSVSKIKLILEINGNKKATCDLKRHLSPKTVGIITRSLPPQSFTLIPQLILV